MQEKRAKMTPEEREAHNKAQRENRKPLTEEQKEQARIRARLWHEQNK
jgi:hypothetical protein